MEIEAELLVRNATVKKRQMENDAHAEQLKENALKMANREAELLERERLCASLVDDHEAVSLDTKYLQKQKAVLEKDIQGSSAIVDVVHRGLVADTALTRVAEALGN